MLQFHLLDFSVSRCLAAEPVNGREDQRGNAKHAQPIPAQGTPMQPLTQGQLMRTNRPDFKGENAQQEDQPGPGRWGWCGWHDRHSVH